MPNAANNAPKVKSSAKVHYFSEKQSYLIEISYLKNDLMRNAKSNSHGGIRLAVCIACLLFHSEKLSHVTLLRNTGQYFSTQNNRMIDESRNNIQPFTFP